LLAGGLDIPQLDAQQDVINDAYAGDIVGSLGRPDMGLAAIPLDTQPVLANRREMRAARDEGHIRPGAGERGAIGSADAAGADHGDAHPILLIQAGSKLGDPISRCETYRDILGGKSWTFREHRTMADVIAAEKSPTA
jgi:hypothetical protein